MPHVEALLLDDPGDNPFLRAALDYFGTTLNGPRKDLLRQVQAVPIMYACLGVKSNKGLTDSKEKEKTARLAFKETVVPGFLKWLKEEGEVDLPPWVTRDMLGRSTINGTSADEPRFYKDGKKVWARFNEIMRDIKKDINPVYDEIRAAHPSGSLPSGLQYSDLFSEFLDKMWEVDCKNKKKLRAAVEVEAEAAFLAPPSGAASTSEEAQGTSQAGGGKKLAESAAGDMPPEAGKEQHCEEEDKSDIGGSADGDGDFDTDSTKGDTGGEGSGKSAGKGSGGAGGTGEGVGNATPSQPSIYPERPANWMHWLTLTFCLFGRPSKSEATDLATARPGSGPPGNQAKNSTGSASTTSDTSDGASGDGKSSEGNRKMSSPGMKHFVGAGDAQSRANVKKELAKEAAKESAETARNEALKLAREQAVMSREVAQAVRNVAADVRLGRQLDQEAACLKRKRAKIDDLRGELSLLDADLDYVRYEEVKAELKDVYRMDSSNFKPDQSTFSDSNSAASPASSGGALAASSVVDPPVSLPVLPPASRASPLPTVAATPSPSVLPLPTAAVMPVSSTTAAPAAPATTAPTADDGSAAAMVAIPALPGFSGGAGESTGSQAGRTGVTTRRRGVRGNRDGTGGGTNPVRV